MKHLFVVNPCAGGRDSSSDIEAAVSALPIDAEVYTTRAPRDATQMVARWCNEHSDEAVRFYACGGDGTLNEVVSGVMEHRAAHTDTYASRRVEVACYPCGSGNDFVRYFDGMAFDDLALQAATTATRTVDAMQVGTAEGTRYCINTLNFGFEAEVCRTMADVRRRPLIGGRMAYTTGIVCSLATGRRTHCRIELDGELWHDGDLLLAGVANGMYDGGGYRCAPRAVPDDGLLEVMAIAPMSLARFAKMIGSYERGTHLDDYRLHDVVHYRRGSRVSLASEHPFYIATDGELLRGTHFDVECIHKAIHFVTPNTAL